MNAVFFLSNYYDGPLKGQGHGQGAEPGNPVHPWHWLKETDQGWESMPLVTGELSLKVGDGKNRKGGISWGCLTTPLLH